MSPIHSVWLAASIAKSGRKDRNVLQGSDRKESIFIPEQCAQLAQALIIGSVNTTTDPWVHIIFLTLLQQERNKQRAVETAVP